MYVNEHYHMQCGAFCRLSMSFQTHAQIKGPYNLPYDLNFFGVRWGKQRNYSEGATFINHTPFSHVRSTVQLTSPNDVWGRVCDTTTSHMLVFVCSAVCSNSQFGRKPTIIPFLKLVLARGWEGFLTQHSHRGIPKFIYCTGLRSHLVSSASKSNQIKYMHLWIWLRVCASDKK